MAEQDHAHTASTALLGGFQKSLVSARALFAAKVTAMGNHFQPAKDDSLAESVTRGSAVSNSIWGIKGPHSRTKALMLLVIGLSAVLCVWQTAEHWSTHAQASTRLARATKPCVPRNVSSTALHYENCGTFYAYNMTTKAWIPASKPLPKQLHELKGFHHQDATWGRGANVTAEETTAEVYRLLRKMTDITNAGQPCWGTSMASDPFHGTMTSIS